MTFQKVAVFGLGSMGIGMARSLVRAGHSVWGFDIRDQVAEEFAKETGNLQTFDQIAGEIDVAVVVVLNAAQAADILFGETGIVREMKPGAVIINCVTVSPEDARLAASRCAQAQLDYLDAPISGGAVKAGEGALSIMASGTPQAFDKSRLCLDAMAETVFSLGDSAGQGSLMKSVNQLLAGVHIATMAEALSFGMKQGLEAETFLQVIQKCAGTSWMLENRTPHIIDGDYTPKSAVNIWLKDLGIVLDAAADVDFDAPITLAALEQYNATADMGLGGEDDSAVVKLYAAQNDITLP
jgi:3-hydroxyisobutyrate dehydrogenase-like beta-hydroxyacid dehydrogenase